MVAINLRDGNSDKRDCIFVSNQLETASLRLRENLARDLASGGQLIINLSVRIHVDGKRREEKRELSDNREVWENSIRIRFNVKLFLL